MNVLCFVLLKRLGRSRLDANKMQKSVAIPSSVHFPCSWLTDIKPKQFLCYDSNIFTQATNGQRIYFRVYTQQPKQKRWHLSFCRDLALVARRKNLKQNFLIWPHIFLSGWLFTASYGYICSSKLNKLVQSSWQRMSYIHAVALSSRAEWLHTNSQLGMVFGLCNTQASPVSWDIRMC